MPKRWNALAGLGVGCKPPIYILHPQKMVSELVTESRILELIKERGCYFLFSYIIHWTLMWLTLDTIPVSSHPHCVTRRRKADLRALPETPTQHVALALKRAAASLKNNYIHPSHVLCGTYEWYISKQDNIVIIIELIWSMRSLSTRVCVDESLWNKIYKKVLSVRNKSISKSTQKYYSTQ